MSRPKNYQRQDVIEKALGIFWRKGYAATSLNDLIEITGLNKRSIYNEFGSKDSLFIEVLRRYSELREPVIQILNQQPLGMDNIFQLLREMAAQIDDRGCILVLSLNERELLSDQALTYVLQSSLGLHDLVKLNIHAGKESLSLEAKTALVDLITAQSFAIVNMAKLGQPKNRIKLAVEAFIGLIESPNHAHS
ncbi:TetR/AcrR family transcriptional regulator [Shewanella sp. 202IG2-18]|uniref:TetR family transcriptional regulator n=1 Tax=Parashewanella hymeniacidonis TaxID=2807618 RepID=UPI001961D2A5|nr:TetR/AcrR family transcriptional regulator [Parashewanella hymeniacidonis]